MININELKKITQTKLDKLRFKDPKEAIVFVDVVLEILKEHPHHITKFIFTSNSKMFKKDLWNNEDFTLKMLALNGSFIMNVKNQTPEMCLIAINQNISCLIDINDITADIGLIYERKRLIKSNHNTMPIQNLHYVSDEIKAYVKNELVKDFKDKLETDLPEKKIEKGMKI